MSKQNNKEILFGYVLHYNPYKDVWAAIKRGDEMSYFNGTLDDNKVLKHKDINTLINGLIKLNG